MLRNNFSKEKIKEIRKKFHERENIVRRLKGLENKSGLKNETKKYQEEIEIKHYTEELTEELKKVEKFFKKLEEDFDRLEKHHYRDNDDLDYKGIRQTENLFGEINEDYYKSIKTKVLLTIITSNMKAEETKTKYYLLGNIFT